MGCGASSGVAGAADSTTCLNDQPPVKPDAGASLVLPAVNAEQRTETGQTATKSKRGRKSRVGNGGCFTSSVRPNTAAMELADNPPFAFSGTPRIDSLRHDLGGNDIFRPVEFIGTGHNSNSVELADCVSGPLDPSATRVYVRQ